MELYLDTKKFKKRYDIYGRPNHYGKYDSLGRFRGKDLNLLRYLRYKKELHNKRLLYMNEEELEEFERDEEYERLRGYPTITTKPPISLILDDESSGEYPEGYLEYPHDFNKFDYQQLSELFHINSNDHFINDNNNKNQHNRKSNVSKCKCDNDYAMKQTIDDIRKVLSFPHYHVVDMFHRISMISNLIDRYDTTKYTKRLIPNQQQISKKRKRDDLKRNCNSKNDYMIFNNEKDKEEEDEYNIHYNTMCITYKELKTESIDDVYDEINNNKNEYELMLFYKELEELSNIII